MSIDNIGGVDLKSLGISAPTAEKKDELGQADFLELLVAQLKHQDPMSPQENGEFLGQMAQFGTVDGIQTLQESFEGLNAALQSNQALQASSLVGRSVQVPSNFGTISQTGTLSGSVKLPGSTSDLSISIVDATGALVRKIDMGTQAAGDVAFTWDGLNHQGEHVPAGQYHVKAEGFQDGQSAAFSTLISANVNSVTIGQSEKLMLSLEGLGAIDFSQVEKIN